MAHPIWNLMIMTSAWKLGGLTWREFGKCLWKHMRKDEIFDRAAQLSYYFLLALFPLLLFLTVLLGYFAAAGTKLRDSLLGYLSTVAPASASALIYETVDEIANRKGGGKLSFGILAALWAASNGIRAISKALNVTYNVEEPRTWWKERLLSIILTVAFGVLIIFALTLLLYGSAIAEDIAAYLGLSTVFIITWKIAQWPIVLAFVLLSFNLIYYFAPNLKHKKWKWVTPGAVVGVALWLLVSFAFRGYIHYFRAYSVTYGSLGAVIVLLLWFYLTSAAILIGGEINSITAQAAARTIPPDAKTYDEESLADVRNCPKLRTT